MRYLLLLLALFLCSPAMAQEPTDSKEKKTVDPAPAKDTQKAEGKALPKRNLTRRERILERRLRALEKRLVRLEDDKAQEKKVNDEAEPKKAEETESLEDYVKGQLKGINLYGVGVASYNYNLNEPPANRNASRLRVSDLDHNSFSPVFFKLGVSRELSEDKDWDAGFKLELAAGRMVEGTLSLDPDFLGGDELNLGNAYVSFQIPTAINPLQIWIGRAYGWFGLESLDLYDSQLFSLSYLANFTPYTNTGVFAEMELVKGVKYMQYVGNGSEVVDDNNDSKTGGGRLTYTNEDESLSVAFHWIYGAEQTNNNHDQRLQLELDVTWVASETTTIWAAFHYGEEENGDITGTKRARFGAVQLIVRQEFAPVEGENYRRFAVIARGTIYRDRGGNNSGINQTLGEATAGLELKVTSNSWIRLEYRLDTSNESNAWPGKRGVLSRRTQDTIALAAAIQF